MMGAQHPGAISLDVGDLAIATSLVLVAGLVSMALRLGLGRTLLLASVRTIVQLLLVGFVLEWIFALEDAFPLFCVLSVMVLFAGRAAVARVERTFTGIFWRSGLTLASTGFITAVVVTGGIIGVDPWYEPQYLLPLLGMILGNSLTGISLCLDKLLEDLDTRVDSIETDLALGASRWEAAREPVTSSIRRGMIPIINSMMVVGVVSLPGMMTGQILAGANPIEAVKYQIVVMFMLVASTAMGSTGVALLTYRRLFNTRHQLERNAIELKSPLGG